MTSTQQISWQEQAIVWLREHADDDSIRGEVSCACSGMESTSTDAVTVERLIATLSAVGGGPPSQSAPLMRNLHEIPEVADSAPALRGTHIVEWKNMVAQRLTHGRKMSDAITDADMYIAALAAAQVNP